MTAVCDQKPSKTDAILALDYEGTKDITVFNDYKEMLASGLCDVVIVAVPHYDHPRLTIDALAAGLNVICEKPAGVYTKQVKEMNEVAAKSDKLFAMMFNQRTNCVYRKMREMVQNGELGEIKRINWLITTWYRSQSYYDSGDWRATWRGEGGVMINQAFHTLDLMQWICGFPSHVIAHTSNDLLQNVIEVEDTASACFECENGTRFNFFATNTATASLPVQIQIKLNTGDLIDAQNEQFCLNHELLASKNEVSMVGKHVWGDGHKALIRDFYDHVSVNKPFPIGLDEGEKVIRIILAMYASGGNRIAIPN